MLQSTLNGHTPTAAFSPPPTAAEGFTVRLTVRLTRLDQEKCLLDIPGVLRVHLRQHEPADRSRQNYPAFPLPDGSVPVLEASLRLHSAEHPEWQTMTIGIPLAILTQPQGDHEVVLSFSGVRWTMYVDGVLRDNDFPFGYPHWSEHATWTRDVEMVRSAALYMPVLVAESKGERPPLTAPISYWTPSGHNSWVGDVATLFHKGRYHLFYLYDRRHHQSKFGCGAHYFEHLSTADFKTWVEHDAATPLEAQWECIGTGTPFVDGDRLCLSYGLHTTRVYPAEKTALPAQWDYLNTHGRTAAFPFGTAPGIPAGSTYAFRAEGVSGFVKSRVLFHPCENPSLFTAPDGTLQMMANYHSRGVWECESVESGWHCLHPDFPPGGDCTFYFRWGRFDYIIGGFTGLWSKPAAAPHEAYEDLVQKGLDFYDGSNVPAISEIPDGRYLMAAWIPIRGWGGCLVLRELVQSPTGRIGSKWMDELVPHTGAPRTPAVQPGVAEVFSTESRSFLLLLEVRPEGRGAGRLGITFLPESGDALACELQLRPQEKRAQFGPGSSLGFASEERSLREGGAPHEGGNFAIENLMGVDGPFLVRVVVKGEDKLGGSLVDAEIAGQRTMITYRPDLTVAKIRLRGEGVAVSAVHIAPLAPLSIPSFS